MWSCINLMIILTACVPVAYSQAVVVSVTDDNKYVCTKPLILKCTVSGVTGCCNTSTRIWTIDNNQIMSNGAEITTSGKYSEKVFNAENEFTLTFDIERKDFEKNFVCSYSVHTSAPLKLNIDDFKCPPDCVECGRVCFLFEFLGSLAGLIMVPIFHLICFTCCQSFFYTRRYFCFKYKRPGDYNYKYCGTEYSKAQVYWKTLLKATIVTMIVILICFVFYGVTIAYVSGIHCYVCYYDNQLYMLFFGFGFFLFMCTFYWTLQFNTDDSFTLCHYLGFEVLTLFIVPIPFLLFWIHYKAKLPKKEDSKEDGNGKPIEL